jgi:hypothetical protein
MSESLKQKLLKRASEIFAELGISDFKIIFSDFSEIGKDPIKKAQGYHPEYHARCDPEHKVIEINTAIIQDEDLSHWRTWDNILAHEAGHVILNTPMVTIYTDEARAQKQASTGTVRPKSVRSARLNSFKPIL